MLKNMDNKEEEISNNDIDDNVTPNFEYKLPKCESTDDTNSNKSTPFYTPLEYCPNTFEFPSPCLENDDDDAASTIFNSAGMKLIKKKSQISSSNFPFENSPTTAVNNTSPVVSRKLRRFSLYERRSCSPQHLLVKSNSTSCSTVVTTTTTTTVAAVVAATSSSSMNLSADKENKKPHKLGHYSVVSLYEGNNENNTIYYRSSGNNSPSSAGDIVATAVSPKILTTTNNNDVSSKCLTYSPKLLSSINNLNLGNNNSPLSALNSASYKTGNYFKFPEIDQQIEKQKCPPPPPPPTTTTSSAILTTSTTTTLESSSSSSSSSSIVDTTRRIKNKNNLTIKITNAATTTTTCCSCNSIEIPTLSTSSPKAKTPTIKATKEKALSLDSANNDHVIVLPQQQQQQQQQELHTNVDEIDAQEARIDDTNESHLTITTNRSTSLLHLSSYTDKQSRNLMRRRQQTIDNDIIIRPLSAHNIAPTSIITNSRTLARHIAPMLNVSNNNLKTLPEFLTLVEFNSAATSGAYSVTNNKDTHIFAFKQKSMDLPNQRIISTAGSSSNLLQRRGSNHSLTLNLHGSCSNLLTNCRGAISVSNYNLGNVVNSKSSGNLVGKQQLSVCGGSNSSSQCVKQNLFRRRGSNQNFTLNTDSIQCGNSMELTTSNPPTMTTASCSNLNVKCGNTPKRGLLERRGSNQSLTLNMSNSSYNNNNSSTQLNVINCNNDEYGRKFYSSESLHSSEYEGKQANFGSESDLQANKNIVNNEGNNLCVNGCNCNRIRHIVTRPLSPQATSEEFKIYLANIQMLQSASNALHLMDLIKLTYTFDNSYTTNSYSLLNVQTEREMNVTFNMSTTTEDNEVSLRYEQVVQNNVLKTMQIDEDEQKRIFRDLHKEFWDLPLNHQEKPMVFGSQTKNRYRTILPNENSRFMLDKENVLLEKLIKENFPQISIKLDEDILNEEMPYINANYIKVNLKKKKK